MSNSYINYIFEKLEHENINYCSWKSNAHLDRSFQSLTDFDLLVAIGDTNKFQQCMVHAGAKRRISTADKTYPGMEDYIAFDPESGKLIHLHVHYKLIFGKSLQKFYRLDLEKIILNTKVFNKTYRIFTIHPELELLILILRTILKIRFTMRDILRAIVRRQIIPINIKEELKYLKNNIDDRKILDGLKNQFPNLVKLTNNADVEKLLNLSLAQAIRLHLGIKKLLIQYKYLNCIESIYNKKSEEDCL